MPFLSSSQQCQSIEGVKQFIRLYIFLKLSFFYFRGIQTVFGFMQDTLITLTLVEAYVMKNVFEESGNSFGWYMNNLLE